MASVWNLQPTGEPTLATNQTAVSPIIRVGSASTLSTNAPIFFPNFLPIVTWNLTFIPPILVGHSFEGGAKINYGNGQTDVFTTLPGETLNSKILFEILYSTVHTTVCLYNIKIVYYCRLPRSAIITAIVQ